GTRCSRTGSTSSPMRSAWAATWGAGCLVLGAGFADQRGGCRMRGRFVGAAIVLVALAAALTAIVSTKGGAAKRDSLVRLSNDGRKITLQHGVIVREAHLERAALLAVRGRLAVYRLDSRHSTCFGTGDSSEVGQVGSVECA